MSANSSATDSDLNPEERKRILRILESNWQAETPVLGRIGGAGI
jgi:hypothetical protein